MIDYVEIKNRCDEASSISRVAIDDFLLHYAAANHSGIKRRPAWMNLSQRAWWRI